MKVGVGYSDNPDTAAAGREVAEAALKQAGLNAPCDLILLFATSVHNAEQLREAVVSVLGGEAPIVGGGAVGAISNERFGYAGDQVVLAAIWLEGVSCKFFAEGGLDDDETIAGARLGKQLAAGGVTPDTPVTLFYDAIDRSKGDLRMVMATYLLEGIQKGLGFLPNLTGAGLQGDYVCTPTRQYLGDKVGAHHALALAFGGDVLVDSIILHGCRPATGYYTVTRADKQTILEINGQPALPFVLSLMGGGTVAGDLPFFLIFGINKGDKWSDFDDRVYANRLCLAVDQKRDGIVMFEPDMVEGTEFQIMQRSLNLDYIAPRIETLFQTLSGREPVFALYIDCAGRAAGYAGLEQDDAVAVQEVVNKYKVPLMGLYTGVEIAPVLGRSRGLDWTGVFILFSVPEKK